MGLGWYDYGARWYDAAIGRFTGVDPIADEFPWVSTYNYAENIPTTAIDLHGLQAVFIHGTTEEQHSFSRRAADELTRIGNNTTAVENIEWADLAALLNNKDTRRLAAWNVSKEILERRQEMIDSEEISAGEPLTLIGYSHGGNVAIQSAQVINDELGIDINLITVSTPAYNNDYPRGGKRYTEDPEQAEGVASHLQIVHENDKVASRWALGNSDLTFTKTDKTSNRVIKNSELPIEGGIKSHYLPSHPQFPRILKTIPSLPKRK